MQQLSKNTRFAMRANWVKPESPTKKLTYPDGFRKETGTEEGIARTAAKL